MVDNYYFERQNILSKLQGYKSDFEIIYFAEWSDFEEHRYIFILRYQNQFYSLQNGFSVMSSDNIDRWEPLPITENQAIELMIKWEEIEENT